MNVIKKTVSDMANIILVIIPSMKLHLLTLKSDPVCRNSLSSLSSEMLSSEESSFSSIISSSSLAREFPVCLYVGISSIVEESLIPETCIRSSVRFNN